MKSTLLLLLSVLFIQTQASIFHWDDERLFDYNKASEWMTDEQKAEIELLKDKPIEFRDKTLEFYNKLPKEKREHWDKFYRKQCIVWLKDVITADEIAELKELESNGNVLELLSKIYSYESRVDEESRKRINVWTKTCEKLQTEGLSRKRREIDRNFNDFIEWMTDEQKQSVDDMKIAGSSFDEIRAKGNELFASLATDRQVRLKEDYKEKCKAYFEKISNPDEVEKMKSLYDTGNDAEILSIVKNVTERLTGYDKQLAIRMQKICKDVINVKVRVHKSIDDKINRRLSWMTYEQKEEVKKMYADGKSQADIRAKIFEFLSAIEGPAGLAAKEQTRNECYKWMEEVATTKEIADLHKMHETDHDSCKKKVREFITRLPDDKREEVEKNLPFCEKVWYGEHAHHSDHGHDHEHHHRHLATRRRRHLHAIDKYIDWLKPEQKSKLKEIENNGSHFDNVMVELKKFYGELPDEKKADLKAKFKSQCFEWVKEVATSDEVNSITKMYELKEYGELKKKLAELEGRLTEERKHTVEHLQDICLDVWAIQSTRKRRDQQKMHQHNFDLALNTHLSWIPDTSSREAFYNEILTILESSSSEVRLNGIEKIKDACQHYGEDILGEENVNIIKELKESGATHEEISQKLDEMIEDMTDPKRKVKALKLSNICRKIYSVGRRLRRDHRHHHHHDLESAFQNYLTWLNDSQKSELKTLKESGQTEEMYKKIMEYFELTSGSVKEKAVIELQSACKHYIKDVVGEDKATKFQAMKQAGTPIDEIVKAVGEVVEKLPSEDVKSRAKAASLLCKKVFTLEKGFRSDNKHVHSLEEAMDKYLSWLSNDQKIVIKSIYDVGDRVALYDKVMEFFDDADGETKEKATNELKNACRHYVTDLIGEENGHLLYQMKEDGASNDAIATKVEEMIESITDESKKQQAIKASTSCKKIYGVARRFRRDHHYEHSLDEALEKYLTWLNEKQKAEVKTIYEGGDREAVYKKLLEFFEAGTGETKKKATMELKSACDDYMKNFIGDENVAKIMKMINSGASNEEFATKVKEIVNAAINDEKRKAKALRVASSCKRIYDVANRFGRYHHHHEYSADDAMQKYLSWLSDEHKTHVKKIYASEDRSATHNKLMEMFESVSGGEKTKAISQLKAACRHYINNYIGNENIAVMKTMKENGATNEAISLKIDEFIAALTDEKRKTQAEQVTSACKKIYGIKDRSGRNQYEIERGDAMIAFLTSISAEQKTELKQFKENNDKDDMHTKITKFLESTTGDVKEKTMDKLKNRCMHFIKLLVGEKNANELKTLGDLGVSVEEWSKKLSEAIDTIVDEEVKVKAEKLSESCRKLHSVSIVHRHIASKYRRYNPDNYYNK